MLTVRISRVVASALLFFASWTAAASDATTKVKEFGSFQQLQHSVIADADAPVGEIRDAVQDSNGFLWLTTATGVVRFDGVAFTRPFNKLLAPYNPPFVILLGPGGASDDLWIGHRLGGVTHIQSGKVTHYEGGNYPTGSTFALHRDRDGVLWAVTTKGIVRLLGGNWTPLPASMRWTRPHPEGLDINETTGDIFASDTNLGDLVMRYGRGYFEQLGRNERKTAVLGLPESAQYERSSTSSNADDVLMPDGSVWGPDVRGIKRSFWTSRPQTGPPTRIDHYTASDGLSDNVVYAFLSDSEGDVWVGSGSGLDRFRSPRFLPRSFPDTVTNAAMVVDRDGVVWVADPQSPPYRVDKDGGITQLKEIGAGVSTLSAEPDGSVWFAGSTGIQRWKGGKVTNVPLSADLAAVQHRFLQLVHDDNGDIWTKAHSFGLYREHNGAWERENGRDGFPADDPLFLARAPDGAIWTTYSGGRIFVRKQGVTRLAAIVPMDTPLVVSFDGGDVWVGGDDGLFRIRGHAVARLAFDSRTAPLYITGVVRGRDGSLWVAGDSGVDRVRPASLREFDSNPKLTVSSDHFDKSEGLGENFALFFGTPSLLFDGNGNLWHAGISGISSADPDLLKFNSVHPKPFVESLTTEHSTFEAAQELVLPALTQAVRIDYTAAMLRRPEHGHFEYRLDEVDTDWQQAGTRRSAFYTKLGPGTYTFRVRAANEDRVRSERDAVYRFQIEPAWYQTLAFEIAVVLTVLFAAWWAYTMRLKTVTERLRIRHDEREHVARDLHDTLLQGFQGLILRFQAVRAHVGAEPQTLGRMIDEALARADQVMEEGRDKVSSLRSIERPEADLPAALLGVAEELSADRTAEVEMVVHGKARSLKTDVHEEALRITREAMINALLHSGCTRVDICVEYNRRYFEVVVRDNGIGFDEAAAHPGHWGLKGMGERSERIRASLTIRSRPGSGTEVTLRIAGRRAYL